MNHEMLIPGDRLPDTKGEVLARARQLGIPGSFLAEDDPAREALLLSLAFANWPDLMPRTPPLSLVQRFYNEYFWFRRFASLWQHRHDPDAGLEQQAFSMLAQTSAEVDWTVIEELDHLARTRRGSGPEA